MTSILTNVAAMSALQTLRSIGQNMETTQDRVSSGQRVGEASDNAAYWSIATTMRSDNGALSAVQDALGLGAAKVDTAYSGMESSIDVVKEIKNKLVAAREPGVDKAKIQEEITQLQDQLKSISSSSSFSGENWLQAKISDGAGNLTDVTKQVVGSFIRDAGGNVSVKTINVALSNGTVLFDTSSGAAKDKQGILDSFAYYSTTGNYRSFDITTTVTATGAKSEKPVAATTFTEAQLSALKPATAGTPVTVTYATGGLATVALGSGTKENGTYLKIGENQYVKVTTTDPAAAGSTTSEVGTIGATKYYLETTAANIDAPTQLTYSLTSLDITKDLKGSFTNADGTALTENQYLDAMVSFVDKQLQSMTSAAADLGSVKMRIDLQENFVNKLTDSLDKGIGRLVDAEMNEESTKLKALQTQQQLAVQALSIANNDSQSILSLFR
ncbi:flagellin [Agrobacterium tumefaciens]|uniref:Flagellin n=1 Tax=Agrobacterium tumefaciens TaxID=358 RepID=A0AA44J6Z9_AGRTU|nr:flagellin [Agrobacterium tumefaciens]NSL22104.1 flagellar hook associated protein [Agrobacterium tumefaciens]NTB85876.1 flagellar hook associated protein [Agrobacterium tumefaciens]NTC19484.1 flagellar hook associated protein [Agrobacterium tumefaciens]NTC26696.1 flagellar hook associated protein [Agrobacterium tumefaciens]NTC57970.1 flagellar hook associated protein [Agrobacterium tumefaciens]